MSGQPVRNGIRAAFALCGLCLIAIAVAIALRHGGDSTSLAALLSGVLLIVVGGVGRLPEEIGLQRISFDPPTQASSCQRALSEVMRHELPYLRSVASEHRGLAVRSYWLDELQLWIVIIWAPDGSYEVDAALESELQQVTGATGIVLITNVEDTQHLRSILQSRHGQRATVVRWRSHHDNEALRRAAHRLSKALTHRRKRTADS
jgi:hypothetical protein